MSKKQASQLVFWVALAPIETYVLAMLLPFLLAGGFSLAAVVVVAVHLVVLMERGKASRLFKIAYAFGALGLSFLAIEFVYPLVPTSLWLWA